jgi:4-amino-4-deoxy-L-arabinose transferase-like glycosyltransferase
MFEKLKDLFKNTKLLLFIIVLLAAALRFYLLGSNPPALNWDEASWGYNAYSIGIDGRDEFGRFLPYDYLESFGDFKPPLYAYLSVIPVWIFGLTEFATRFASAFFGTLTVLVTYFLVRNLFPQHRSLALISSLFLAISPWHIMLSRAAFEANVATFFIVSGIWLFFKSLNSNPYFLILSVISFVLSTYTFNSARIVAPLLLLILAIWHFRKLLSQKKVLALSIVTGLIFILPISGFLFSDKASLRYKEVNIFSNNEVLENANQSIENDGNAWWSRIIHNRRVVYTREFLEHYFDNLSPKFLFTSGDPNPKFSTKDMGQMYLWDLPFFITGLLFLFRNKNKNWLFVPVWLLIGIIPAAFARETPHALRIEGSLPTFQIITAFGFLTFVKYINNLKKKINMLKNIIVLLSIFLLIGNVFYYLRGYYLFYPKEESGEWQYGYKETVNYINVMGEDYETVYFTKYLGRPYIYVLFYNKYDPKKFREEAKVTRDNFGFVHVENFGKYYFPDEFPSANLSGGKELFVNNPKMVPPKANVLNQFYILNGKPVFAVYTL